MPFFKNGLNSNDTQKEDGSGADKDDFMDCSKMPANKDPLTEFVAKNPSFTVAKKVFPPIKKTIVKRRAPVTRNISYYKRPLPYNNKWDEKNDANLKDSLPIPENVETLYFAVSPENVIYIEDACSIYSAVHGVKNLQYRDMHFRTVDEGYQYYKLLDLCEEPFKYQFQTKPNTYLQRNYVKRCLAQNGKTRMDVVTWRQEKGMKILFELTLQKFIQNPDLYEIMKEDKDKLILNIFGQDNYDACGRVEDLQVWLQQNNNQTVKIPNTKDFKNLKIFPKISTGKNLQGIIVMLVRNQLQQVNYH